jgi:hypothetical protein
VFHTTAGETHPAIRDVGFLDVAAREAARGAGLLDAAVRWYATAGFLIAVSEKSFFQVVKQSRFNLRNLSSIKMNQNVHFKKTERKN